MEKEREGEKLVKQEIECLVEGCAVSRLLETGHMTRKKERERERERKNLFHFV